MRERARREDPRSSAGWVRGTTRNPPDPGARPDLLAPLATLLALLAVRHLHHLYPLSIATSSRGGSDEPLERSRVREFVRRDDSVRNVRGALPPLRREGIIRFERRLRRLPQRRLEFGRVMR